jgi:hypothetical protein
MLNDIFSVQKPLPMFEITEMTKPESHSSLDPLLHVSFPDLPCERNKRPGRAARTARNRH